MPQAIAMWGDHVYKDIEKQFYLCPVHIALVTEKSG